MRHINATLKKTFGLWIYQPVEKEKIRCLCPKCLKDYIHHPDYIVRRLDPFAKAKSKCDKLKKVATKELKDKDTTETEFKCSCCGRRVKVLYCAGAAKVFCPYCGVDI